MSETTPSAHHRLQARLRLEAAGERYGLWVVSASPGVLLLPWGQFPTLRVGGLALGPPELVALAAQHDLRADDIGLHLHTDNTPVDALEDRLIGFLEALTDRFPEVFLSPPPARPQVGSAGPPETQRLSLQRYRAGGFVQPRVAPALVVDLAGSRGPFLRAHSTEALQLFDATAQGGSLPGGYQPPALQAALDNGAFDTAFADATARPDAAVFNDRLSESALSIPGLPHLAVCASHPEALQKALHLASRYVGRRSPDSPAKRRIIGFEGGPGLWPYEVTHVRFPITDRPGRSPVAPRGWRSEWSNPQGRREFPGDRLLQLELQALETVELGFRLGDVLAVVLPARSMDDRDITSRFAQALRALTRGAGVPLIVDEGEAGLGMAEGLFWHRRFWLTTGDGAPDTPDAVVLGGRAQQGLVLSAWPDPYPARPHRAAAIRGAVNIAVAQPYQERAKELGARLEALAGQWPRGLMTSVRVDGHTAAFELPNPAVAHGVWEQRFGVGLDLGWVRPRTITLRTGLATGPREIEWLILGLDRALAALVDAAGGPGPGLFERMKALDPPGWPVAQGRSGPRTLRDATRVLRDGTGAEADRVLLTDGELSPERRLACRRHAGLSDDARGLSAATVLRTHPVTDLREATGVSFMHFVADLLGAHIRRVSAPQIDALLGGITTLWTEAHGTNRRAGLARLRVLAEACDAVVLVAEAPDGLVGLCVGAPLELFWGHDGPQQDPHLGRNDTLYSASLLVAQAASGRGLGQRLRHALLAEARRARTAEGAPRFAFVSGRVRADRATLAWRQNQRLGAYAARTLVGQYGEETGRAHYYRIPLRRRDRRAFSAPQTPTRLDLSGGLHSPTGSHHPALARARDLGALDGPGLTRLEWPYLITPDQIRYVEYLSAIRPPNMAHVVFADSADAQFDVVSRVLSAVRPAARGLLSFDGGFGGVTGALARSLTDWTAFHGVLADSGAGGLRSEQASRVMDERFFEWPRVPWPDGDGAATIAALDAILGSDGADTGAKDTGAKDTGAKDTGAKDTGAKDTDPRHGAASRLGLVIEPVQARTGRVLSPQAWAALCAFRDRSGLPLVVVETTTGLYRNGQRRWWLETVEGQADVVVWHAGGQLGHVFVSEAFGERAYTDPPADALSATRLLWQCFAITQTEVEAAARRLDEGLERAGYAAEALGMGLYRVLTLPERGAETLARELETQRIVLTRVGPRRFVICPPVTVSATAIDRLLHALTEAAR